MEHFCVMNATFGQVLAELRKERGLLQWQVAAMVGVNTSTVARWETDTRECGLEYQRAVYRALRTNRREFCRRQRAGVT